MKKKDLIIFCAGGTAGHIFPAVALANQLSAHGVEMILITDKRGIKYVNKDGKQDFNKIIKLPIKRFGISFFVQCPYLFLRSMFALSKAKKIICFGGYTTLFPFLAACILRKERIIYQLDAHITRLNRMLIPLANKVFYGFAQTDLKNKKDTYCFGIPLRDGFEFSFIKKEDRLNIAIIGGSLGSIYWKELLIDTLEILPEAVRKKIFLKIQTTENLDFLNKYHLGGVESRQFYDTAALFRISHLIIARAGATSIAEISSVARAAYLVPWEHAVENHQYENARNYANFEAAEFGNDPQQLADYMMRIFQSNDFFYRVCENASKAFPQFAKNKASSFIASGDMRNKNQDFFR